MRGPNRYGGSRTAHSKANVALMSR